MIVGSDKLIIVMEKGLENILDLIEEEFGSFQRYYAESCIKAGICNYIGYDAFDLLLKLTCGYEDDTYLFKYANHREIWSRIKEIEKYRPDINMIWYKICYYPWRIYRANKRHGQSKKIIPPSL